MIKKSEADSYGIAITDGKSRLETDREELRKKLHELMPCLVNTDGCMDIKALRDVVDTANSTSDDQGYELTFAGKGLARAEADRPTGYELKAEWSQSKNFDSTGNAVIRGDNLDVLKILYQNYFGKVKMIYIDPPYNTKSENFVYKDDFKQSDASLIAQFGMKEETADFLHNVFGTRSHSGWLAFMYPRLKLARSLLTDDGVLLVQIDYNESHSLKLILDEIFGENNFKEEIIWEYRTGGMPTKSNCFGKKHDTIFAYSKQSSSYQFDNKSLKERIYYENDFFGCNTDTEGRFYFDVNIRDIVGGEINTVENGHVKTMNVKPLINVSNERIDGFKTQKPSELIKFLTKFYLKSDEHQIILDFFAGTGTTGDAIMQLNAEDGGNRKFILVQSDEEIEPEQSSKTHQFCADNNIEPVISSITLERLNRAGEKIEGGGGVSLRT
ncbi:MAG: site-specific DNA-methyltransferase [Gammaproteobacteria bacterium]|nr:site-specific DNA-methyltransferase [Gammaproteobacteria bacterium]